VRTHLHLRPWNGSAVARESLEGRKLKSGCHKVVYAGVWHPGLGRYGGPWRPLQYRRVCAARKASRTHGGSNLRVVSVREGQFLNSGSRVSLPRNFRQCTVSCFVRIFQSSV